MDKSNGRTISTVQTANEIREPSRKAVGLNRVPSSESNHDNAELCVSTKDKTPELNGQPNLRSNFADLMKFGQLYGALPPQYFEQFSGIPMQHPLYVGAMFPPVALPDASFPYPPYMFPQPQFTFGNPHMYAEPLIANGKRERASGEVDRKEYRDRDRDTDVETQDRQDRTGKKNETKRAEPETKRKESVIKNIGVVRDRVENGKGFGDHTQKIKANSQNGKIDLRTTKMERQRKEDKEGMVPSISGNFTVRGTEERPGQLSPPMLSRAHDVTNRLSESKTRTFASFAPTQSTTMDSMHYTTGAPGYMYSSPRTPYDPSGYRDKKVQGVDEQTRNSSRNRPKLWEAPKDDSRMKRNGEDREGEFGSSRVIDSPEKIREIEEIRSRSDSPNENARHMNFQRQFDRRFYNDYHDRHMRDGEEFANRRFRREQSMKLDRRRTENERERSPTPGAMPSFRDGLSNHTLTKANFPTLSAPMDNHSVEKIMNGRSSSSPAKQLHSDRRKEDVRTSNERNYSREETKHRVSEIFDPKRVEMTPRDDFSREQQARDLVSRGQRFNDDELRRRRSREDELRGERSLGEKVSRERLSREQRSRDQKSESELYEEMKAAEMERLRSQSSIEPSRIDIPFYVPRFMNPTMFDPRGFDHRVYGHKSNFRSEVDYRDLEARRYESRKESSEMRTKGSFSEHVEDKRRNVEGQDTRSGSRAETAVEKHRSEQLRAFCNTDERPRTAQQAGIRSASPRVNGADVKVGMTEKERKSRGASADMNGHADGVEFKRNIPDSGTPIGQSSTSKRRSPLAKPVKDERRDDVKVSKASSTLELTRTPEVCRVENNAESSSSNGMRTGLGNCFMGPAAPGYPGLPMLSPEACVQQFLAAQLLACPVSDPNHPVMMPNEYMMKAWGEFLQDPSLVSQLACFNQRLAQEKALFAGEDMFPYFGPPVSPERQRELLKLFPQHILELQKRQQQLQEYLQQRSAKHDRQWKETVQTKEDKQELKRNCEENEAVVKRSDERRERESLERKRKEEEVRQLQMRSLMMQKQFQDEQRLRQQVETQQMEQPERTITTSEQQKQEQQQLRQKVELLPDKNEKQQQQEQRQQQQQQQEQRQQQQQQQQRQQQQQHQQQHQQHRQQQQQKQHQQQQLQQQQQQQQQLPQQEQQLRLQQQQQQSQLQQGRSQSPVQQRERLHAQFQSQQLLLPHQQLFQQLQQQQQLRQQQEQQQQQQQKIQEMLLERQQYFQFPNQQQQPPENHRYFREFSKSSDQTFTNEDVKTRTVENSRQQPLAKEFAGQTQDVQKVSVSLESLVEEERNMFQFPEPRVSEDCRRSQGPPVSTTTASVVPELLPRMSDFKPTPQTVVSDVGELSPNCVSAAEVLSRFRTSSSMCFVATEEKRENVEEQTTGLDTHEIDSVPDTSRELQDRFPFYEKSEEDDHVCGAAGEAEPAELKVILHDDQGHVKHTRTREDLSDLARAAISNEEQFGTADEGFVKTSEPEEELNEELETTNSDEDVLSDECSAGELSPLSEFGDSDRWWWISRSPCVPSARRLPNYLEEKENLYAQIKLNERQRLKICENINRLRREAKKGLTKDAKDRYSTLSNHKLILDAESVLNAACTNIKAATEIDGLQVELRDQLLNIQRTYRERHRELSRLTPKHKDKHEQENPVKRGPGRPRKRKNFCTSKSNMCNNVENSPPTSPAGDHVENGSPSAETADPTDQELEADEGANDKDSEYDGDYPGVCVDNENDAHTDAISETNDNENPELDGNNWEVAEPPYEAEPEDLPEESDVIPKKKLKKKRRRIMSDSDPELASHPGSLEKPKKSKKSKKTKSKSTDTEEERRQICKIKQNDDDVFTSDGAEQGLSLLAKCSPESNSVSGDKDSQKKRKISTISDDGPAPKQRSQKKKPSKLNLKSSPKDCTGSANDEGPTKSAEVRTKDSDHFARRGLNECVEKSPEKTLKSKAGASTSLTGNDDFFPRRSERIFLSSSSSLNSPTAFSSFEIPAVNKKKVKPSGKVFKKKDLDSPEPESASVEEANERETSGEKELARKKRKVKIKQEEKKKAKSKRKGSVGDFTDEEYDEQTFVEEIKQLPKRNRHAPRRYLEYDSGDEKLDDEESVNEQQNDEDIESEGERTEADLEDAPIVDPPEEDPTGADTEIAEKADSISHREEMLDSNIAKNSTDNQGNKMSDVVDGEKESRLEEETDQEDAVNEIDVKKDETKTEAEHEGEGKARFPWMFSMDELCKGQKILLPDEGVYYPARISEIHIPDLYAIILDGARGRRPHFRSSEQLLTDAVKDVQPNSLDEIPLGTRVCAYWSQQYRCFYPGLVSEVPEDENLRRNCCWVEFDDGDSGEFPLQDVRLIPPDFPQEGDCDSNPGVPESRPKKPVLSDDGKRTRDEVVEDDLVSDSGESTFENGPYNDRTKNEKDKKREGWKETNHEKRLKKDYSKSGSRRVDDDYDRSKTTKYRTLSLGSESSKSSRPERSNSKKKLKIDIVKEYDTLQGEEGVTRDDEGDVEWSIGDVFSDESPLTGKRFSKFSPGDGSGGEEPEVLVYPPDQIWRWAGKPCPNKRKRRGRKVFYKSIYRGDEQISVGDCAVFLSSPSKNPNLPYVGKIIKMWERFNGSKVVRVKWFYHPEETKAGRRPSDGKNGLYLSSHVDENDVQTIAHKCEVLQLQDYKNKKNVKSNETDSEVTNNSIFWCIGTYDPLTETFPSDND